MKKVSRGAVRMEKPEITIGLDLGDRFSHYCMLNGRVPAPHVSGDMGIVPTE